MQCKHLIQKTGLKKMNCAKKVFKDLDLFPIKDFNLLNPKCKKWLKK